jgi:NitT/TauT family transport system ATP-binding protein
MTDKIILHTENISKSFDKNLDVKVISDINLDVKENEIVSFLGKSGTGKSTFLRIIAGLSTPTTGTVTCCDKLITEPSKHISMVFQNFALLPWLTVFDNVSFGLDALNMNKDVIRKKVSRILDIIGLTGYENSYPKELSGGMRQRVGFARALVIEPDLLLLDEPFSALDIYTSSKIRSDLISLWENKEINTKSIILVTHNVEEAVMMSDRILVWGSNPGTIRKEFIVPEVKTLRTRRNMFEKIEEISAFMHQQIAISEQYGKREKE